MQIGSYTVELLSEGRFEIFNDGHINRSSGDEMPAPANLPGKSAVVGINPVLVQTPAYKVLLDTGLGWGLDAGSSNQEVSNVRTNLDIFGVKPEDITHVILSHLHYDHAAGSSFTNEQSKTEVTFPNATYFVHQQEWEYALSQIDLLQKQPGADYRLDDFYRLVGDRRITFLENEITEVVKGITAVWTGGHTPGHQIVIIKSDGESAYYLGDLLPSSAHLNHYAMSKLDISPVQAKKKKVQLLRTAYKEQACLFFYHSLYSQAGSLLKNKNQQYVLKEL